MYQRINGIHESLKSNSMKLQAVPVNIPVENALKALQGMKDFDDIQISMFLPAVIPHVIIDESYFEQALINIIQNGVESMLQTDKPVHSLSVSVHERKRSVVLEITDNGTGIDEKDLVNIFTPLFSTKPQTTSWGIGLSLAHNIITSCGGRVFVKSTPGEGTSFDIELLGELV